jgi:hypothetical protein
MTEARRQQIAELAMQLWLRTIPDKPFEECWSEAEHRIDAELVGLASGADPAAR